MRIKPFDWSTNHCHILIRINGVNRMDPWKQHFIKWQAKQFLTGGNDVRIQNQSMGFQRVSWGKDIGPMDYSSRPGSMGWQRQTSPANFAIRWASADPWRRGGTVDRQNSRSLQFLPDKVARDWLSCHWQGLLGQQGWLIWILQLTFQPQLFQL